MRRSTFLAALALGACARRVAHAVTSPGSGRPVHIAALGDSLVLGVGASAPDRGFVFRSYLRVRAAHPGSRLRAYAVGGATVADVEAVQTGRVRTAPAEVIVLCVGGNDVTRRTDPAAFDVSYRTVVAALRAAHPHARLVACGVPDVGLSPLFGSIDGANAARLSREYDGAVRRIAHEAGAAFVDLYAVTQRAHGDAARFLSDDRFHPSDRGYAILADALAPALLRAAGPS